MRVHPRHMRALGAVLTGTALISLAACGSDGPTGGAAGGDASATKPVAAVIKGLDNPFFQLMQDGLNAQAKTAGATVEVQAAQSITDTTGQAERLSALSQQDFGCFVVNPISGNNLVQGLAQVAAKDVPVVNIDSPIDSQAADAAGLKVATYIGTDNADAGAMAGDEMVKAVGSGTVAVIGGIAGDVTSEARISGFTEKAQAAGLTLVPTVSADWERQKALTSATDLIAAHPDLKGIFAANDDMGLGAARAVANAGKSGQIKVVSVDGNSDALDAVKSGELTATVAQYPYAIGQMGLQACQKAMSGAQLPADVKAPVALVTADVVDQAKAAYPAPFAPFENPLG
ncbi:substrate-binding domain-containing protein [Pseudonocardia lutea]|uniref:Substrate-binding domain-containing protein n=1 Tax=Pseudonocardia lutea TaxID=2172015 RepID=A0ABW1I257_9PSEU